MLDLQATPPTVAPDGEVNAVEVSLQLGDFVNEYVKLWLTPNRIMRVTRGWVPYVFWNIVLVWHLFLRCGETWA